MATETTPICRVAGHRFGGSHVALSTEPGCQWCARNRKVLLCDEANKERVVWEAADAVVGLLLGTGETWAFAASGQFAVLAASGMVLATGSLGRPFVCGAPLPAEGVAVSVADHEILTLYVRVSANGDRVAHVRSLFQIDDPVATMHVFVERGVPVLIVLSESGNVYCWNTTDDQDISATFGDARIPLENGERVAASALLVSTSALWIGTSTGGMWVVELRRRIVSLSAQHDAAVCGIIEVPNSHFVWSASVDGSVVVWDSAVQMAVGSFQVNGAALRSLQVGWSLTQSTVSFLQTDGNVAMWEVSAPLHGRHDSEPKDLEATTLMKDYHEALAQSVEILAGTLSEPAFAKSVLDAIPELVYVGEALKSLAECSAEINRALHELSITPTSLIHDTAHLADSLIAAVEIDRRARQAGFGERGGSRSWTGLSAALDAALAAAETKAEYSAALRRSDTLQRQCDMLSEKLDLLEAQRNHSRASTGPDQSAEIAKLREELEAKNAFVVELLQIVKDNTSCIEELRTKYRAKKTMLMAEQSRTRDLSRKIQVAVNAIERHCNKTPQPHDDRIEDLLNALDHIR